MATASGGGRAVTAECVIPDGANAYVDAGAAPGGNGSRGAPYVSIQAGVDAGGRVIIAPGTYAEQLVVGEAHDGLVLEAACPGTVFLDSQDFAPFSYAISVNARRSDIGIAGISVSRGPAAGIAMQAGRLTLTDVSLLDNQQVGLLVAGLGANVEAVRLRVGGTRVVGDLAVGVYLSSGGGLHCEDCEIVGTEGLGFGLAAAARLTMEGGRVADNGIGSTTFGDGVQVMDGSVADLLDVVIEGNEFFGVLVDGKGSTLSLGNAVVRGHDHAVQGGAINIWNGGSATVSATRVADNRGWGIMATGPGSSADIEGGTVSGMLERISQRDGEEKGDAAAIASGEGATVNVRDTHIRDGQVLGLAASAASLVADHVVVSGGRSTQHAAGVGALVWSGGTMVVSDSTFENNEVIGLRSQGAGSRLTLLRSRVAGTYGAGEVNGAAIYTEDSGEAFLEDVLIVGTQGVGLLSDAGGQVHAVRTTIDDTDTWRGGSRILGGMGAVVTNVDDEAAVAGNLTFDAGVIRGSHLAGALAIGAGNVLMINQSSVEATSGPAYAAGIGALHGAQLRCEQTRIADTRGSSIIVAAATGSLVDCVVTGSTGVPEYTAAGALQVQEGAVVEASRLTIQDVAGPGVVVAGAEVTCVDCAISGTTFAGALATEGGALTMRGGAVSGVSRDATLGAGVGVYVGPDSTVALMDMTVSGAPLAALWLEQGRMTATNCALASGAGLAIREDLSVHGNVTFAGPGSVLHLSGCTLTSGESVAVLFDGATGNVAGNMWSAGAMVVEQGCVADEAAVVGWQEAPRGDMCPVESVLTFSFPYSMGLPEVAAEL